MKKTFKQGKYNMNNLLHCFSIKISGSDFDDKIFFNESDYDASTAVPSYDETVLKGKAYIRMKHLKRILSTYAIPVYMDVKFGTPSTASTAGKDLEIVVGYISIEPLLSTLKRDEYDESNMFEKAAEVLSTSIVDAFKDNSLTELMSVRSSSTRDKNALTNPTQIEVYDVHQEYLEADAVTLTPVVEYIEIK